MSSTRRDEKSQFSWISDEGELLVRKIVQKHVIQWPSGPRAHQLESWVYTLSKKSILLIAATGSGKTATFYGPILVMLHLLKSPVEGIPSPPSHPVALIVTPLVELGNNQVTEMERFGLRALALNAETLSVATNKGKNLYDEIAKCLWHVVLLSAERLASPPLDAVIRNDFFRKNIALLGIDEAHVLVPWGVEFRTAYQRVSDLHKRLPEGVPLVVVTATLSPGAPYDSLCSALDLRKGEFHSLRLSCERPNIKTVILPAGHSLAGQAFPVIKWVFQSKRKAVVYCRTLELGFRVARYGWSLFPSDATRLLNVRVWNSLSSSDYNQKTLEIFRQQESTCIIVASIGFGMGMDLPNIDYSINLGRNLVRESFGITYVEPPVYSAIQMAVLAKANPTTLEATVPRKLTDIPNKKKAGGGGVAAPPLETIVSNKAEVVQSNHEQPAASIKSTSKKPKGTKARTKKIKPAIETQALITHGGRTIEKNLSRVLCAAVEGRCIEVEKNLIYDNPGNAVTLDCNRAPHRLSCSSCQPFSPPMDITTPTPSEPPDTPAENMTKKPPKVFGPPLPPALNTIDPGRVIY
ncbi:hypothetical protein H0H93_003378 [Arthromyces matolae]|nr:hypothetical protein H0H93_003378 [Arthromyces matolae]